MTDLDPTRGAWRACAREPLTLAYLAGDVTDAERELAEAHLAGCDACRETAALFARLLADETPEETLVVAPLARRTARAAREMMRSGVAEPLPAIDIAPEARRADARWWIVVWVVLTAVAVAAAVMAALSLRP